MPARLLHHPSRVTTPTRPTTDFAEALLDPLPTARATAAIAELCEHLTATQTRYPGTDLVLRYEVTARP